MFYLCKNKYLTNIVPENLIHSLEIMKFEKNSLLSRFLTSMTSFGIVPD